MHIGKSRVLALLAVVSIAASACSSSTCVSAEAAVTHRRQVQPRHPRRPPVSRRRTQPSTRARETLYTTGKQWGAPSTWNPLDPNAAMGVVGLQYETLFLYDPLKDVYTPWLATSGYLG